MGEIIDVLEVLNPKKATGPDKISHRLLMECKNEVAEPLYIIFNLSVQKSVFPTKWKLAHVIPIFKKVIHLFPLIVVLYHW